MQTRKTRWQQFILLLSGIACAGVAGILWFVMGDDEGNSCYSWKVKVVGVVTVLMVAVGLIYLTYWWLLAWRVEWSN